MTKVYKSEVGIEMYIILILMSLLNIYLLVSEDFDLILVLIIFSPIAFLIYIINATNYIIEDDGILYINSSFFFSGKVALNEIKKIEEVTNILSAPAMSIKRLELFYGKYDSILISPKNKNQFIKNILALNKDIQVKLK